MFGETWLNFTQLSILGVKEHHIYFIIFLILMGLVYFMITPFIKWLMSMQSSKLLCYIVSSLLFLIMLFILTMMSKSLGHSLEYFLKITLQCLSIFGVFLFIQSIIGRFLKKHS